MGLDLLKVSLVIPFTDMVFNLAHPRQVAMYFHNPVVSAMAILVIG